MNSIRHLLDVKGHDTWLVRPDALVLDALQMMKEKDVSALLVMEKGELKGIFTEKDYARKGEIMGRLAQNTRVQELMTPAPVTLHPDQTVQEAIHLMATRHFGHLPVVENGQVVGVISAGDLLRERVYQQKRAIQQLETRVLAETPRIQEKLKGDNDPYDFGLPLGE